jgi:hypothetical protein
MGGRGALIELVGPEARIHPDTLWSCTTTCSIIIGHSSTQARQVVQDHSVSGWIRASGPTS